MRKIVKYLVNSIYIIAILILASILVTTLLTGTPSIFGFRPMFVVSESMEPVIKKHQFILAVVVDVEDVKVGDIIGIKVKDENALFSKLVVHRIIGINEDGTLILKGDANPTALEYEKQVSREDVKYRVILYQVYLTNLSGICFRPFLSS